MTTFSTFSFGLTRKPASYAPVCFYLLQRFSFLIILLLFQFLHCFSQAQPYYPPEVTNPQNQTYVAGMWYYTSEYYNCTEPYYDDPQICVAWESGYELWRSNGTAAGTVKIQTYVSYGSMEEGNPAFASAFIAVNNYLYFINGQNPDYLYLYKINNTSTEPTLVKRFFISESAYSELYKSPSDYHLTVVNGKLFLTVKDDVNGLYGTELWRTDGTAAGTVMVKDILPGEGSSGPADLRNENGILYFTADDGNGRKLWKSDGTPQGTLKTVAPAGKIGREYWANKTGTTVSTIPLTTAPTSTSQLTLFEGPSNTADNYGARIRGYINAPATGNYIFWIASDDNSELWLSTDATAANKRKIASVTGITGIREWTKYTSQKSVAIALQAGKSYYIEALHKEGGGGDNLAVGWQLPNGTLERPIPGSRLSPISTPLVRITAPAAATTITAGNSITISASAEDYVGSITKVEFFANTTKLGEDASSPFTYFWSNVPAGTYTITARATNNFGVTTTSATVPVTSRQIAGTAKQWDKTFGSGYSDSQGKVIQTSDGGYLVYGFSYSDTGGEKSQPSRGGYDYWIVKTNASGNKLWDKTFGGSAYDEIITAIQTVDGGYLLGGYSDSNISGDKTQAGRGGYDYWIVKTDASGNKLWDKTFGGSSKDILSAIVPISGGYLLSGYSDSNISGDKTQAGRGENDYWIVKTDASGNKLWDKTFGGSGDDKLTSMVQTSDNHFLLGGSSSSGISYERTQANKGPISQYNDYWYDYWIIKINDSGNIQWDKAYGTINNDALISMVKTTDDGYLLVGNNSSGINGDKTQDLAGFWLLKINNSGAKQWDKTIGTSSYYTNLETAVSSPDGGCILGITSNAKAGINKTEDSRAGSTDYWIIKVNNLGVKQWDRTFGGDSMDYLWSVITTSDGAYVLAGESYSPIGYDKSEASRGSSDFWIVKTVPDPQASTNKSPVVSITAPVNNAAFTAPASITITANATDNDGTISKVEFYNGATKLGEDVTSPYSFTWNNVAAGTYSLTAKATDNKTATASSAAVSITVNSPSTASQWNYRFGGSANDVITNSIKTSDGGYLLGGRTESDISGDKTEAGRGGIDYWVVKVSSTGAKQWDKRFGGSANEYLNAVIQTSDGGYLLGGHSLSGAGGDKTEASRGAADYWIVKISSTGTKLWDKRFGGTGLEDFRALIGLPGGEFLLAGVSASGVGGDKTEASQGGNDYWIVKVSSTGTKLWDKRFGGSLNDFMEAAIATSDGGFLLGGRSDSGISGNKTQASQGGNDYWVVKVNSSGAKLWDKRFGGTLNDNLFSLAGNSDGSFLLAGTSASGIGADKTQASQGGNDYWVVKISSTGTKLWDKRFGGPTSDDLRSVITTTDGGYLIGGRSDSGLGGDKTQASWGMTDFWIVKLTSSGNKQWDKRFGGTGSEELRTILQANDGGYALCGLSDSGINGDKTQTSRGLTDYWMVKIGSSGTAANILAASQTRQGVEEEGFIEEDKALTASPNPFTDRVLLNFTLASTERVSLKLYDELGQQVAILYEGEAEGGKMYTYEWQPVAQKAGVYIVRLTTVGKALHKKIILIR